MLPLAYAQNNNIEVTPIQDVTPHELAALHVLNEICPTLVKDKNAFEQGYQRFLEHYLPNSKNPLQQLSAFAQNSRFQPILDEAKSDAQRIGNTKNTEICQELSVYSP